MALLLWGLWPVPTHAEPFTEPVRRVFDGDTLALRSGTVVRFIGINCPERAKKQTPAEPLAEAAYRFTRLAIANRRVRLLPGPERHDRYGRLLAHVLTADGTDLGRALVRAGMCAAVAIPPNIERAEDYFEAEAQAREAGLGLWADAYFLARSAGALTAADRGFRFVSGPIRRASSSRRFRLLHMESGFVIRIPRADWTRYWSGGPQAWVGQAVVVRGWVSPYRGGLGVRIGHPRMLTARRISDP